MPISSVQANGLQGVQWGMQNLNVQAQKIANPLESDKTDAVVMTKMDQTAIEANLKVLKTADELVGSLLDIKA